MTVNEWLAQAKDLEGKITFGGKISSKNIYIVNLFVSLMNSMLKL